MSDAKANAVESYKRTDHDGTAHSSGSSSSSGSGNSSNSLLNSHLPVDRGNFTVEGHTVHYSGSGASRSPAMVPNNSDNSRSFTPSAALQILLEGNAVIIRNG